MNGTTTRARTTCRMTRTTGENFVTTMDVEIDYTNHRGERSTRRVRPFKLTWGLSPWHPGKQWILLAHDLEKKSDREFAMNNIHSWKQL